MIKLGNLVKLLNVKVKMNRRKSKQYQVISITDDLRKEIVNSPQKYHYLDIRVRMGKFYTDEELEEKRNKILSKKLP